MVLYKLINQTEINHKQKKDPEKAYNPKNAFNQSNHTKYVVKEKLIEFFEVALKNSIG